jgi:hypothetical protein
MLHWNIIRIERTLRSSLKITRSVEDPKEKVQCVYRNIRECCRSCFRESGCLLAVWNRERRHSLKERPYINSKLEQCAYEGHGVCWVEARVLEKGHHRYMEYNRPNLSSPSRLDVLPSVSALSATRLATRRYQYDLRDSSWNVPECSVFSFHTTAGASGPH